MSNYILRDSCTDEKNFSEILKIMTRTGESITNVAMVLLNEIPEDKFATSLWIKNSLADLGINIEMHDLTPKLNILKRKGKYCWIEGREINRNDKTLVDVDLPTGLKCPRIKMRLNEEGRRKAKKILNSIR